MAGKKQKCRFDSPFALLLSELAKRRPVDRTAEIDRAEEAARQIRALYHPKQRAFFCSSARFRATRKTRRAGATTGGCREMIARAITQPGFRGTYVTTTRREARDRAWTSDSKSGFVDVLRQLGQNVEHPSLEVVEVGGVQCMIYDQAMVLKFENGSQIDLFGADDERALRKQRGAAKHVYWIDEAQDFRFLDKFYDAVVLGSLTDTHGECWLSGTPGVDCVGMFYEATKDPGDDGAPLENWEVHELTYADNPFFGTVFQGENGRWYVIDNLRKQYGPFDDEAEAEAAARVVREDRTAGEAKRQKNWKGDEPDFVREWRARWVREDARYVYPVHTVPKHDLIYAPIRPARNPFVGTHPRFDHHPPWFDLKKAISDLPKMPKYNKRREWMFAIGVDFGYSPDPFALAAWAFAHDTDHVYELMSWKCVRVHTDDQGAYMKLLWDALENVVVFVGDPAGKVDDFEMWRDRMGLPIEAANKRGKNTLEEFLADDIRRQRIHFRGDPTDPRACSPLLTEMRHLVYLPTLPGRPREVAKHRRTGDGVVHGDHCCDCARYSYSALSHYLARTPDTVPAPGTPAALAREAEAHERRVDAADRLRAQQLADADERMLAEIIEDTLYSY